jgi:hypothetical protein
VQQATKGRLRAPFLLCGFAARNVQHDERLAA